MEIKEWDIWGARKRLKQALKKRRANQKLVGIKLEGPQKLSNLKLEVKLKEKRKEGLRHD